MKEIIPHKFDGKTTVSYRNLMKEAFEGQVKMARILEKQVGKDKAHELIYKMRVESDLEQVENQLNEAGKPENFVEFKKLMHMLHENDFALNLFTITYPVDTETETVFMTKECIMAEVFKELEATDLGYLMVCKPDYETTPFYNENVYLRRTKCLMLGDTCCDTTYCWRKNSK